VAGLIHRDVSPSNILVSFEGEVKLTDFGIARVQGAGGLTGPGTLKGKVGYMAPEHATGAPVDARADIFALGVVLWEMCTGQRLFARDTEVATLRVLIGDERISPPSFWNELVPAELDAIVLGALERDPDRRTASADEMDRRLAEVELALSRTPEERDLRPLMRRLWPGEIPSRPTPTPSPPPGAPQAGAAQAGARQPAPPAAEPSLRDASTATWPPRRRWRIAALTAGIALVVATIGAGWWGGARVASPPVTTGAATSVRVESMPPVQPAAAEPVVSPPVASPPAAVPPMAAVAPPTRAKSTRPQPSAPARNRVEGARTVLASADALEGLQIPPAASGEGLLFVNVTPWAEIHLDGRAEGYTPREMRLAAGTYRLTLVHPTRGTVVKHAEVRAGERVRLETTMGP
jgi:serine/threonine-protein kinase